MNQTAHLFRVQKLDLELDHNLKRIQEIDRFINSDKTIQTAERQVQTAESNLQKTRQKLCEVEETARSIRTKIEISESKLYGGKIINPKELQDIQNEIASLKRHLTHVEDDQLEAMIDSEKSELSLTEAKTNLSTAQADFAERSAGLLGEKGQLQKENERLSKERAATLSFISEDALKLYQNLRAQKNGRAMAGIEDQCCAACGTSLRPAELQSARSSGITFCPSCGRILYAG